MPVISPDKGNESVTDVHATGVGKQLPGGASGVCETRGSHRAVAGGLGKGLAEKSTTQRATEVAAGGFPVATGGYRAIQLTRAACGNGTAFVPANTAARFCRPASSR